LESRGKNGNKIEANQNSSQSVSRARGKKKKEQSGSIGPTSRKTIGWNASKNR